MLAKAVFVFCGAALLLGVRGTSSLNIDQRIGDGQYAKRGAFPWQVSIQTDAYYHVCGGSIISNDYILTAARCSMNATSKYRILAGVLRLNSAGSRHNVLEITNQAYDPILRVNDISVWKIDPPFEFDEDIKAVRLPAQGVETPVDTYLDVAGWGSAYLGGPNQDDLQEITVPIVDKKECDERHVDFGGIEPNQICAGYGSGQTPCERDAGGALVFEGEQRGIVSWNVGCGLAGFPAVYTEVSAFRNWIRQISGV